MFFAVDFTIFLRAAGIVITSIDQLQQSLPRWAKRKYIPFLDDVKNVIAQPLSLQTACSIAVRECVMLNGPLWRGVDQLPVPPLLMKSLKMTSGDFGNMLCL